MAANKQGQNNDKITALYCRLSVEDLKDSGDSLPNSIVNQKQILTDFAKQRGYTNTMFFIDDGISGTSFEREGFKRMQRMAEEGKIGTIIVKDLSRFGREQVEAGRLTQIVYPSLGITFISIQENVNSSTGEGVEMMPFYHIFNEWYAAQTSKKIRAVLRSMAEHGKRVSPIVPYGYIKDPNNREQWIIDEPAAAVVREIFALCLEGKGPTQIAVQLEKESVLVPTAYFASMGRKPGHVMPKHPYRWQQGTVVHILGNRQYTGCAVNFKSSSVSYKVKQKVYYSPDDYQVIPNMQEPIIDEDTWLRVQELRNNRRRISVTGRKSLFSGLVFCNECGAKLYYYASKNTKLYQDCFVCANYKSGRGDCTAHYIREKVLKEIVGEAVRNLSEFVRLYEPVFLYMLTKKNDALQKAEFKKLTREVENGEKRMIELDRLISKIYEDNALGRLDDVRFDKLMRGYESEQKELEVTIANNQKKLESAEQQKLDLRLLMKNLREFTEIRELTPTLVNSLIRRIVVHDKEKRDGHRWMKVDVYFTAIGMINIPDEKEILRMSEEIAKDAKKLRVTG